MVGADESLGANLHLSVASEWSSSLPPDAVTLQVRSFTFAFCPHLWAAGGETYIGT